MKTPLASSSTPQKSRDMQRQLVLEHPNGRSAIRTGALQQVLVDVPPEDRASDQRQEDHQEDHIRHVEQHAERAAAEQ